MQDRTLGGLLALWDRCHASKTGVQEESDQILNQIYMGHPYDPKGGYHQTFLMSGFISGGGYDDSSFVVYSFGWSRRPAPEPSRGICMSYSKRWYRGPHDLALLKQYNPEDLRLKPREEGPLDQLAWLQVESRVREEWDQNCQEVIGYLPENELLIRECYSRTQRIDQLWSRCNFVLRKINDILQDHLYQTRLAQGGNYSRRRGAGPGIRIGDRDFHFEGEDLIPGKPFETYEFSLETAAPEDPHYRLYKHANLKTSRIRKYLREKAKQHKAKYEGGE